MRTGSLEPRIDGVPAHDEEDCMMELGVPHNGEFHQQCQLGCCLMSECCGSHTDYTRRTRVIEQRSLRHHSSCSRKRASTEF